MNVLVIINQNQQCLCFVVLRWWPYHTYVWAPVQWCTRRTERLCPPFRWEPFWPSLFISTTAQAKPYTATTQCLASPPTGAAKSGNETVYMTCNTYSVPTLQASIISKWQCSYYSQQIYTTPIIVNKNQCCLQGEAMATPKKKKKKLCPPCWPTCLPQPIITVYI